MAGMPKLNMGAVKDKDKDRDDKEKKTLKESMRQLSRKASASLKRGLTPRGSRVDRQSSFDSLDEAARHEDSLAGALGLRDSGISGVSDTESDIANISQSEPSHSDLPMSDPPPLVAAPPAEHERLPQFEPSDSAPQAASKVPAPTSLLDATHLPTPFQSTGLGALDPESTMRRVSFGKPPVPREASAERMSSRLSSGPLLGSGRKGSSDDKEAAKLPSVVAKLSAVPNSGNGNGDTVTVDLQLRRRANDGQESALAKPAAASGELPGSPIHQELSAGHFLVAKNEVPPPPSLAPAPAPSAELPAGLDALPKAQPETDKTLGDEGDPQPLVQAPPVQHETLPQFEPAGEITAAAKASAQEPVPASAEAAEPQPTVEHEAAAKVQDPATSARAGRPQWQKALLAVSVFGIGVIAAEPALDAWRRRQPIAPPPVVDAKAAKKRGGWGFS